MRAIFTVDLGYGDSGKGTIVDSLVRKHSSKLVVRYNGGSQAGHNVVTADGIHHTFAQFGAGMLVKDRVLSLLGPAMLVDLHSMVDENSYLLQKGITDALARTYIHEDCFLITPYHIALNRIKEIARGDSRHGSCGKGIGETRRLSLTPDAPALQVRHLANKPLTVSILNRIKDLVTREVMDYVPENLSLIETELAYLRWSAETLADELIAIKGQVNVIDYDGAKRLISSQAEPVIFEGSQGVLLDEDHGFGPFNTWSRTTTEEGDALLEVIDYRGDSTTIGILRAFHTRHGPGPFPTENLELTSKFKDSYNPFNPFQREFRVGWFDMVMFRYAMAIQANVDCLAITHCDWLKAAADQYERILICGHYKYENTLYEPPFDEARIEDLHEERTEAMNLVEPVYSKIRAQDLLEVLHCVGGVPIHITSNGPSHENKEYSVV